ncbi:hypothetical protein, partial [Asaia platycodi]|uniref:hypothetical protein n=1 Tax=Asaia platycodi TaxID=610243 RepID=UPI001A7E6622
AAGADGASGSRPVPSSALRRRVRITPTPIMAEAMRRPPIPISAALRQLRTGTGLCLSWHLCSPLSERYPGDPDPNGY